jgi:CRISPR-associated protein Cas1
MIKRTIEISGQKNHLSISLGSLIVKQERAVIGRIPLEDIGVLLLDAADTTYTHHVLMRVMQAGAVIIPCGTDHLPAGLFLPQNNSLQTQRLILQSKAPQPLRKQLWKQIVQCKIRHQAANLHHDNAGSEFLLELVSQVRSGDPTNIEAQAAKKYWRCMFGPSFRRDPDGDPPNNLLNYGYMVMRAAIARAICAAGLHPSLGLHHHNRNNHFCLADDLLEPFRPLIDSEVKLLYEQGHREIERDTKIALLQLLTTEISIDSQNGPLMVNLSRMIASLVQCYAGEAKKLQLPVL